MKFEVNKENQLTILDQDRTLRLTAALDKFIVAMVGVKSKMTIAWYRSMLQPLIDYLGDVEVNQIEVDDLRQWRGTLASREQRWPDHPKMKPKKGGLKITSLHAHVRACKRLFRWLVDEGKLEVDPAYRLELPPKPKGIRRGISDDDRMKIIEAVDSPRCRMRERDMAMIHFLDDSTCRVGGVIGLTLDRLDLAKRRAYVFEKGLGGQNKGRFVYFSPTTTKLLQDWLAVRPNCDNDSVFVSAAGKPLATKGLYQVLDRAAERAGVKTGWNPHNWRHGTIRRMKKMGVNLAIVSQVAGHSGMQLTADLYGTLDEDELQEALEGVMWRSDEPDVGDLMS